jgi:hypothetical protein
VRGRGQLEARAEERFERQMARHRAEQAAREAEVPGASSAAASRRRKLSKRLLARYSKTGAAAHFEAGQPFDPALLKQSSKRAYGALRLQIDLAEVDAEPIVCYSEVA